ncbi:hypothetical protein SEA_MOLLYMUR_19 [Gordonia phage Mollymur]|uniref:Uncharacterized protein n=1 Tax=Gordonia phage Mollymur TaxID=2590895 RepID=A0A4Y6EBN2_9CAUD|nr:hypothetical protein PQB84_gp106 [Gordonia phage Mollymur]QDF15380.1 hypothetical protein SEA_MOLLYMUR_19 [Gordonia phage Mollymur]
MSATPRGPAPGFIHLTHSKDDIAVMARLTSYVFATSPEGQSVLLGPDTDPLPTWVARVVTNPLAWDEVPEQPDVEEFIDSLPDVAEDLVTAVSEAPEPVVELEAEGPTEPTEPTEVVELPAKSDAKPLWVAYAKSVGIDPAGMTTAQIQAAVEAQTGA